MASRAVARSPSASSPVHASYRSRAKTSRYDPKYVFAGSPADTACPHGDARLATIAPGKVLSSDALSTFALRKYAASSRCRCVTETPGNFSVRGRVSVAS